MAWQVFALLVDIFLSFWHVAEMATELEGQFSFRAAKMGSFQNPPLLDIVEQPPDFMFLQHLHQQQRDRRHAGNKLRRQKAVNTATAPTPYWGITIIIWLIQRCAGSL